jgi:transposase-like protein
MADDKTKLGSADPDRVARGQDYEVEYFARRYGISPDQVHQLIRQLGNDRGKLDEAAAKLTTCA